jgi:hypothetical protein
MLVQPSIVAQIAPDGHANRKRLFCTPALGHGTIPGSWQEHPQCLCRLAFVYSKRVLIEGPAISAAGIAVASIASFALMKINLLPIYKKISRNF